MKSGWGNKIGTPDTFINLFSNCKYIVPDACIADVAQLEVVCSAG